MKDGIAIVGKKYGRLTILHRIDSKAKHLKVLVKCECGLEKITDWQSLKNGSTKSCGCLRNEILAANRKLIPTIGAKYNRWTIVKESDMVCGDTYVLAQCDCGIERLLSLSAIICGGSKSCGCLRRERTSIKKSTHRLCKHPLYSVWNGIKDRCRNPNSNISQYYVDIGVTVCDEWDADFKVFYDWCMTNGWEKGLQIDKDIIPKKLGIPALIYSPEMCSIVTPKENSRARKDRKYFTYKGETKLLIEWCEQFNKRYKLVRQRIGEIGWSFEKAMDFI